MKNLRVAEEHITILEMYRWYKIEENRLVYLIDANHCPGAVCFVFKVYDRFHLHTGDFRASKQFYKQFAPLIDADIYDLQNKHIENVKKYEFYNLYDEIKCYQIHQNVFYSKKENFHKNTGTNVERISDTDDNQASQKFLQLNEGFETKENQMTIDSVAKYTERKEIAYPEVQAPLDCYKKVQKHNENYADILYNHLYGNLYENISEVINKLTIINMQFTKVFLDNTFEHFKFFDTQEKIIHKILQIINSKNKGCLIPINYKYLFATYSIGKEKIFLSVAEYLDCPVQVEKRKMDLYSCFDEYTTERINKEVKNIVSNYKQCNETKKSVKFDFFKVNKKNKIRVENNVKMSILEGFTRKKQMENKINYKEGENNVFARITGHSEKNSIELISMMHTHKAKIQEMCKKYDNDRICIFVGSGWNDKTIYYDYITKNGRCIKKGIEVHYLPYSEHSSDAELTAFKNKMRYKELVNTVKNTWNAN